ncbi:3-deoxy-7-phosphoheptulonate synthase [Nonomuraea diastatica]|uniref:Phospho-2-dehydro-3-deoxyheptonate aldolase n=1 Tax=Nonomuraea diastatica TaxID=1848329 RepID=A0A4R4WG18_9ACTN|nr:3-deoxy-7-phosphoheptulonate synthase [Nonomuraea diastatica]TDD17261.1 3-deoxy-7-phosphoheptulonate synthase [Nonomuraea diastatica]
MHTVRAIHPRIEVVEPLPSPAALRAEIPLSLGAQDVVLGARRDIVQTLKGTDDRLVVVTGPCSVHDPVAALAYAERLSELSRDVSGELLIVMRVYVEKPRTRLGWKGLVSDPRLDGTHDLASGLRLARGLMAEIVGMGLPVACEFLDPAVPAYLSDLVSWAAIGARTVESQIHRQFTSGLDMPVGMKNGTAGGVEHAIDAIVAAAGGHVFPAVGDDGSAAIVATAGNPDCHVVLRGGANGPNYGPVDVARALDLLGSAGLPRSLFVDASHGNSGKDHERQPVVVGEIAERLALGERGIAGVMVESFLTAGRQDLVLGRTDDLTFGQSVTDACVDWGQTIRMIEDLAQSVTARRRLAEAPLLAG